MDNFLTSDEVAKRLNVHQNTVLRFIRAGKLAATRIGKSYRIRESTLSAFIGDPPLRSHTATVIAVSNQKGGVAKTTTTVNLATTLGRMGRRVLVVDLDPQGGCAVCIGADTSKLDKTVYNVLLDHKVGMHKVILKTDYAFDLAPSNIDLAGAEVELKQKLAQENILTRALESVLDKYDYIVIDTPPSLGLLTVNALTAASHVLIPVACEYMALRGLAMLLGTIEDVRAITNPRLKILGILATKYDSRTLNSREIYSYLENFSAKHEIHFFQGYIKHSVKITEAPGYGRPFIDLYPMLDSTEAYHHLAQEIVNGIET